MRVVKWILGIGCVLLLVSIRFFEDTLFHDPLVSFFKSNFTTMEPPNFEKWKLIGFTSLRYLMNTILSLLILLLAFPKKSILKFSGLFLRIGICSLNSNFLCASFSDGSRKLYVLVLCASVFNTAYFSSLIITGILLPTKHKKNRLVSRF